MPRYGSATSRPQWSVALSLTAVVAAVLMLVAPDSPLHTINARYDSNWFLTAGRAWALGLTPYVDFSDSKGPLLWLIYRVGYMLSRHDFTGVFALVSLCYMGTYWFAYRTASLWLRRPMAVAVAVLSTLAWFNPVFFNEIRADDFCHLPITLSLYVTARALYGRRERGPVAACFIVGVCTAALMLIKYNIAAMNSVFAVTLLWHYRRRFAAALLWGLAGMATVILPMAALLWRDGCLGACVNEYFLLTAVTTTAEAPLVDFLGRIWRGITSWNVMVWGCLLTGIAGAALMSVLVRRYRWWPLAVFAWFLLPTLLLSWQAHHFSSLSAMYLFAAISVMAMVEPRVSGGGERTVVGAAIVLALACATVQNFYSPNYHANWRWKDSDNRREYDRHSAIVAQHPRSRILFWRCYDTGVGTRGEALPAIRYWAKQSGATAAMNDAQDTAVVRRVADFIVIHHRADPDLAPTLRSAGYHRHADPVPAPLFCLYEKR